MEVNKKEEGVGDSTADENDDLSAKEDSATNEEMQDDKQGLYSWWFNNLIMSFPYKNKMVLKYTEWFSNSHLCLNKI